MHQKSNKFRLDIELMQCHLHCIAYFPINILLGICKTVTHTSLTNPTKLYPDVMPFCVGKN